MSTFDSILDTLNGITKQAQSGKPLATIDTTVNNDTILKLAVGLFAAILFSGLIIVVVNSVINGKNKKVVVANSYPNTGVRGLAGSRRKKSH